MRKHYYARWIFVFGSLGILTLGYFIFENRVLQFWCDHEENNSACFLLSKKHSDLDQRKIYLEKSCDLNYEAACKELKKEPEIKTEL